MFWIVFIAVVSVLVVVGICVLFGALTADLYERKGYKGGFIFGFFFGAIALIYAAGLPVNNKRTIERHEQKSNAYEDRKAINEEVECIACGVCQSICPMQAITFTGDVPVIDENKCVNCNKCLNSCPTLAIYKYKKTK